MPTSSTRLRIRARAYQDLGHEAERWASKADDAMEADELYRLAFRLDSEYHRLTELADKREQKEQGHDKA